MADLIDRDALLKDMGLTDAVKYGNKDAEQQYRSYSTWMSYEIADSIRDAPAVNRWIPVEDEYPEPCKSVLIAFCDSSGVRLQCVGIRSATHPNVWLDMHGGRIKNVTHWQSLPEPPEKE